MISSMTSYIQETANFSWGNVVWEIRSVNHRYLDVNFHLPEAYRSLEQAARELLTRYLARGRMEVALRYRPGPEAPVHYEINPVLLQKLTAAIEQAQQYVADLNVDALSLLNSHGIMQVVWDSVAVNEQAILQLFEKTLQHSVQIRQREGAALQHFLLEKVAAMRMEITKATQALPKILADQKQKIKNQLADLQLQPVSERLEQELVFWAQKVDVAEELTRLEIHLTEITRLLQEGGVIGRRLDFLMQELNREANTLGSKSISTITTQISIEMKVLIEQMREQIQNIE